MDLVYELKSFTSYTCYRCGSRHYMSYYPDEYTCEECYDVIPFHEVDYADEDFDIEWEKIKRLLVTHDNPREVVQTFIQHIQREEVDENKIDEILYQFHQTSLFLGH